MKSVSTEPPLSKFNTERDAPLLIQHQYYKEVLKAVTDRRDIEHDALRLRSALPDEV